MGGRPELDRRQSHVLASLVTEYIATGQPVGSLTLARRYGLEVSAATIRNTMADLEAMGLAFQPHTSAGRIPTDLGIRLFVDAMMEVRLLTQGEQTLIRERYSRVAGTNDPLKSTGRLLADLTEQATVVVAPRPDAVVLRQLRFLLVEGREVLALLITSAGVIQSRLLAVDFALDPALLERMHNYLNSFIPGKTLAEACMAVEAEVEQTRRTVDELRTRALELGRSALQGVEESSSVLVEGQARLSHKPEFGDVERLRRPLDLLDDREQLAKLLSATARADGIQIVIGGEHPLTRSADCSVVTVSFRHGAQARGTLGVIGPRSMDYGKVVPLVEYTARLLSEPPERPC